MKIESVSKNQNSTGKIKNKVFLAILVIVMIFVGLNFFKGWRQTKQINGEITGLEQEINNLEQDNLEFRELIEYFNSNAYIEEKARLDLGLKKDGEKVVVVNTNNNLSQIKQPKLPSYIGETEMSNPQKWWNLFFKK